MKRLIAIIKNYDTEPAELWLGLIHIGLGLILLLPAPVFQIYAGYRLLAISGLPEWAWGILALALGSGKWFAIAHQYNHARFLIGAAAATYWLIWAVLIGFAGPLSPGSYVYFCLALASFWCRVRAHTSMV